MGAGQVRTSLLFCGAAVLLALSPVRADLRHHWPLDEMAGRPCRFVWGNMDTPTGPIRAYLQTVGIPVPGDGGTAFEVDGKRVMVFHGHEPSFGRAIQEGAADYILHGHTHDACDERVNGVRVINPGALHRAEPKTVATLDTAVDVVRFHEIDPG